MSARDTNTSRIRDILARHGRLGCPLDAIGDHEDLYQAGLTSHASVNVMLALESEFEIEFPDHMLRRDVFESVASMREAINRLVDGSGTSTHGEARA
jgi:acyl carrier protein